MKKSLTFLAGALASLALVTPATAALLLQEEFDDLGGSWENWTGHFDQQNSYADDVVNITGGKLVFSGDAASGTDTIASTDEMNTNVTIEATVSIGAAAAGGFFSLGAHASTGGGSPVDFDLYEDAGSFSIGIYEGSGNYGTSAVVLSPQPTVGTDYKMIAERDGDTYTLTLKDAADTVLGTTTRTLTGKAVAGNLLLKCLALQVSVDDVYVVDNTAATPDWADFFDGSTEAEKKAKWFIEPNPDVSEGGAGGMRIYNLAVSQFGADRPDFLTPGYLRMRGYSRVTTRWDTTDYPWFGDVDVMAKLKFEADSQFSIGLDNRTNEGQRRAILLDSATTGQTNGVNNPSIHIMSNAAYPTTYSFVSSTSLNGLWNPATTPDIYLYARRNGNTATAWIGNDATGAAIAGSTVTGSIAGANASGQLVPTAHTGNVLIDRFIVWDYNTGWTAATPSSVSDWELFD